MRVKGPSAGCAELDCAQRVRPSTVTLLALALALFVISASCVYALDPQRPLTSYGHQVWSTENGLPQNTVQAVAQSGDGFLWVGTEAGLARFDGFGFRIFDRNSTPALPGSDIRCLQATQDGALWIATNAGVISWKSGVATVYGAGSGLPESPVLALGQNKDGRIVVWAEQGAFLLSGNGFVAAESQELTALSVLSFASEVEARTLARAVLADGTQVTASRAVVQLHAEGRSLIAPTSLRAGRELPGSRIQSLFADREGVLWIGTNAGLARWYKGKVEGFAAGDALATASILALMEDREGNLWIGAEADGLHILRNQRFRIFDQRDGLSSSRISAVVEDKTGSLWVGTQGAGLNCLSRSSSTIGWRVTRTLSVKDGLASDVILSLAAAANGGLWVGTPDGLNRVHGHEVDTFSSADGLPDDFVRSLLMDADGTLWVGTRRGLTHWLNPNGVRAGIGSKTYTQSDGLGSDLVGAMARDAKGDLWVATLAGLSRLHNGTVSTFTTRDGLPDNVITALLPRVSGGMVAGTQNSGWANWNGQRFLPIVSSEAARMAVRAILEDAEGNLWLATSSGIARCGASPAVQASTSCSSWMSFGVADGLRTREMAGNSHPSAAQSKDGVLWFATANGLAAVDPAHFQINTVPPPVVLERFIVDDVEQAQVAPGAKRRIEAGPVHFEFDYAGLSFVAPQKVRYRYMLEGFDRGWTDAGVRRTAYYTNIPPGRYTFRVQAANNDGVWNTEGAMFSFELRPHFYQMLWFRVLLIALLAAAIFAGVRLRLLAARRAFNAVLSERNRIAREIHDTLAQGYVGASVQLELVAELLHQKRTDVAEEQLKMLRGNIREGLADARQSIWALRAGDDAEMTLPVQIRRVVEHGVDDGLACSFELRGVYRQLSQDMEREVLRIAQEAVHNVKKHARASQLRVLLEYGASALVLEVADNGRGCLELSSTEAMPGHFGVKGMRERAQLIDGTLMLESMPGQGTTVRLTAPVAAVPEGEAV